MAMSLDGAWKAVRNLRGIDQDSTFMAVSAGAYTYKFGDSILDEPGEPTIMRLKKSANFSSSSFSNGDLLEKAFPWVESSKSLTGQDRAYYCGSNLNKSIKNAYVSVFVGTSLNYCISSGKRSEVIFKNSGQEDVLIIAS